MKGKIFLLMLFFASSVYGQNHLTGTWVIDSTVVKQTIDSVFVTTKVYPASDTAKSFVQRPEKITFAANQVTFEYAKRTVSARYTINGDTLQVAFPTHIADYQYTLEQGKLQLNQTTKYRIVSNKKTQQVEEQYIFKGRKR
jgi:hypothetical protein